MTETMIFLLANRTQTNAYLFSGYDRSILCTLSSINYVGFGSAVAGKKGARAGDQSFILVSAIEEDTQYENAGKVYVFSQPPTGIECKVCINTKTPSIYPNPSGGKFIIQVRLEAETDLTLELHNINGELLLIKQLSKILGEVSESFDLKDHPKGMYYLKMSTQDDVWIQRVVYQ